MLHLALAITAGSILAIYLLKRCSRTYLLAEKIGGPKGLPILGNALVFLQKEFLDAMLEMDKLYNGIARFWIGHKLVIGLNNPLYYDEILSSKNALDKGDFYHFMDPLFGQGLIASDAKIWQNNRKIVAPTLNVIKVKSHVPVFAEAGEEIVTKWREKVEIEFEPYNDVSEIAFGVIMRTALGSGTDFNRNKTAEMVHLINCISEAIAYRFIRPWLYPDILFSLTPTGRQLSKATKTFRTFLKGLIDLKKDTLLRVESEGFLDHVLSAARLNKGFTNGALLDELSTYMTAGFETSSTAITFSLVMLGCHPELQALVLAEQEEIFSDCDKLTWEALNKMDYLEMFIKETMRLYPVITVIGRQLSSDTSLGEFTLPKGAFALIPIYAIHRNSLFWPEPEKFLPLRFSKNSEKSKAFLPFGGGSRICMGKRYAITSMKAILSSIVRSFVITTNYKMEEIKISKSVTLNTKGLKIMLKSRETVNNFE